MTIAYVDSSCFVAISFGERGAKRLAFASVSVMVKQPHMLGPGAARQELAGSVARAVVDDDQLVRCGELRLEHRVDRPLHRGALVVHRHED